MRSKRVGCDLATEQQHYFSCDVLDPECSRVSFFIGLCLLVKKQMKDIIVAAF